MLRAAICGPIPTRPIVRPPVSNPSGVTCRVTRPVPRPTSIARGLPGFRCRTPTRSYHSRIGPPSTATTVSPGSIPPFAAGHPGSTRSTTAGCQGARAPAAATRSSSASAGTRSTTLRLSLTVIDTLDPPPIRIPDDTWSHDVTGRPLTAVTRSPTVSRPRAAAPAGRPARSTRPIRVSGRTCFPFFAARKMNAAQAKRMFIVTPARVTIIRFQTGRSS